MYRILTPLLLILFWLSPVTATEFFAHPSGSGSTCSAGSPCSLTTCINTATAGHTCTLQDGTYSNVELNTVHNGTASNRITIQAQNLYGATLSKSSGNIALLCHDYTTIRNIVFNMNQTGGANGGLRIVPLFCSRASMTGVVIEWNKILNAGRACFHMGAGGGNNGIFRYNIIQDCGFQEWWGEGAYFGELVDSSRPSSNWEIYGNVISGSTEEGWDFRTFVENVDFHHNIVTNMLYSSDHGSPAHPTDGHQNYSCVTVGGRNVNIRNNLFYSNKVETFGCLTVGKDNNAQVHHNVVILGSGPAAAVDAKTWNNWDNGIQSRVYNNTFYSISSNCNNCTSGNFTTFDNIGLNVSGNTTTSNGSWYVDPDNASIAAKDFNLVVSATPRGIGAGGTNRGAFQEVTLTSCTTVDADTDQCNFSTIFTPVKVLSNCSGITPKVDGNACTASNCAITGDTVLTYDVSGSGGCGSRNSGHTLTTDFAYAAVKDSLDIPTSLAGATTMNSTLRAITGQSVTNTLEGGGPTVGVLTQQHYRCRQADISSSIADFDAFEARTTLLNGGLDTPCSIPPGGSFILFVEWGCSGGDDCSDGSYSSYARLNGGSWAAIGDTYGSIAIRKVNDKYISPLTAITTTLSGCSLQASTSTFRQAGSETYPTYVLADGNCAMAGLVLQLDPTATAGTDVVEVCMRRNGEELDDCTDGMAVINAIAPYAQR